MQLRCWFDVKKLLMFPVTRPILVFLYLMVTMPLKVLTQRNFLAYFFRQILNFSSKTDKNSSADEIANVNFFYDDIAHVLQNTKKRTYFI